MERCKTLDEAQIAKMDLICKKINIKEGEKILDIGCSWGSFANYASRECKAKVVGITVPKEQTEYASLASGAF